MNTKAVLSVLSLLLVAAVGLALAQSAKEAEGQAAEKAGKLREALTHYVAAIQSVSEGSGDDQRLRETIIKLVQRLSSPPAIPEEARRFSVRGQVWVKEAKNPSDFDEAAKEFGKALRVAPWWADGYINHGVSLEKAGKYNEAIRSLKLYLLAAPRASDADKVKDQIYTLELRQEKAQKDAQAKRGAEEEASRRVQRERQGLEGVWNTGPDPANSVQYRLSLSQNEVRIYMTGYCVVGRCTDTNALTFRGSLRSDRSMSGSVIIESVTVGNRGAYCEFTGGEFPATAQISPNYNEISFSVQGERRYTGLCSRAGTTMPASHNTMRKR